MARRWALVTGAGRRIGAVIAERLAAADWNLLLHANRSLESAETLAASLRERFGIEAAVVAQDLAVLDDLDAFTARCADIAGPIDLLVNNASLFNFDDASTVSPENLELCYRVNCAAPVLLSRYYGERLRPAKNGAIINVIDTKVTAPNGRFLSYELSKCALASATIALARAFAPDIRVNGVAPGLTLPSGTQTDEQFDRLHARTPLRRGVAPEDVANAVLYLANAPTVTGQIIAVDAGQWLARDDKDLYDSMT